MYKDAIECIYIHKEKRSWELCMCTKCYMYICIYKHVFEDVCTNTKYQHAVYVMSMHMQQCAAHTQRMA